MADRQIVYTNEVPFETDVLNTNKNAYVGLGRFTDAVLGSTTQANGFNTVPLAVPDLKVDVEQGEIYEQQAVDSIPYGEVPADPSLIQKQGILTETVTLDTAAPVGVGNSVDYLIQVSFLQIDTNITNRPYFNSTDPSSPIFIAQVELRENNAIVTAKQGIEATTGTQVPPAPDPGNVGLYIVTVDFGQTEVLAPDIVIDPNSPLIVADDKLKDKGGVNKENTWIEVQTSKISVCEVQKLAAPIQSIPNGVPTIITTFEATPLIDNDNIWNSTLKRFEPKRLGLYQLWVQASWRPNVATTQHGFRELGVKKNGSSLRILSGANDYDIGETGGSTTAGSGVEFITTIGDFLEIQISHDYGVTMDLESVVAVLYYIGTI